MKTNPWLRAVVCATMAIFGAHAWAAAVDGEPTAAASASFDGTTTSTSITWNEDATSPTYNTSTPFGQGVVIDGTSSTRTTPLSYGAGSNFPSSITTGTGVTVAIVANLESISLSSTPAVLWSIAPVASWQSSAVNSYALTLSQEDGTKKLNVVYAPGTSASNNSTPLSVELPSTSTNYHLIAVTISQTGGLSLSVDGTTTSEDSSSLTTTTSSVTFTGIGLGRAYGGMSGPFSSSNYTTADGAIIDEFRLYNSVLDSDTLSSFYTLLQDYLNPTVYSRTLTTGENSWVEESWASGDSTGLAAPSGTSASVTVTTDASGSTLSIDDTASVGFLTTTGDGALTIVAGTTTDDTAGSLTATSTSLGTNTTITSGVSSLGAVTIGSGKTLSVTGDTLNIASSISAADSTAGISVDATAGDTLTNSASLIKSFGGVTTFTGTDSTGATLDFGTANSSGLSGRLVFSGGSHTLTYGSANETLLFGPSSTDAAPVIDVAGSTTLNFTMKDLSGWTSSSSGGSRIIRVRENAALNFEMGSGTAYFSNRLVLDNGAKVTNNNDDGNFRVNGGTRSETTAQFAMLDAESASTATITGNDITLPDNATKGMAIAVGSNATLTIENTITSTQADATVQKYGSGTLVLTGANDYVGPTTISAGTVKLSGTGTIGTGDIAISSGATLELAGTSDATIANTITGEGTITQSGAATTTFSGDVAASALTVSAGSVDVTGTLSATDVTVSAGTVDVTGTLSATTVTVAEGATLSATNLTATSISNAGTLTIAAGQESLLTASSGSLNLLLTTAQLASGYTATFADGVSNSATITFYKTTTDGITAVTDSDGTVSSDGTSFTPTAITYTPTTNSGTEGEYLWSTAGNWSSGSVPADNSETPIILNFTSLTDTTATFTVDADTTLPTVTILTNSDQTVTIAGSNALTVSTQLVVSGNVTATNTNLVFTDGAVDIGSGYTLTYTDASSTSTLPSITGDGTLSLSTSAALRDLSSTNTYDATIEVTSGTLRVASSVADANEYHLVIRSGASLTVSGSGTGSLTNTASTVTLYGGSTLNLYNGGSSSYGTVAAAITITDADTTAVTIAGGAQSGAYSNITGAITGSGLLTYQAYNASSTVYNTTISGVISGDIALTVAEGALLTLSGTNTYTGGTAIAGTLTASAAGALGSGTITGAGNLSIASGITLSNTTGLTAEAWTGTVTVTGSLSGFDLNSYGYSGSTIEFNGASGYITAAGGTYPMTIKLTGDGWSSTDGNGGGVVQAFTGKLTGSGTFTHSASKPAAGQIYKFTGDVSEFTGSITVANNQRVAFGDLTYSDVTAGTIAVATTNVVVGSGATWSAASGITVTTAGDLTVNGAIASSGGAFTVNGKATLVGTNENTISGGTTVSSTGTLVLNGTEAETKMLADSHTITVEEGGTLQLTKGMIYSSIDCSGTMEVTGGTFILGLSSTPNTISVTNTTVASDGILSIRDWSGSDSNVSLTNLAVEGTVQNGSGEYTPSITVTGTLSGTGTISLATTLASGATLTVTDATDPLTISGNVTCGETLSIVLPDGTSIDSAVTLISSTGTVTAPTSATVTIGTTVDSSAVVSAVSGTGLQVVAVKLPTKADGDTTETTLDATAQTKILAAMTTAGVTSIATVTGSTNTNSGSTEKLSTESINNVLSCFNDVVTVDSTTSTATVAYDFGISGMSISGTNLTVTAKVQGANAAAATFADGTTVVLTVTVGETPTTYTMDTTAGDGTATATFAVPSGTASFEVSVTTDTVTTDY